MIDGGMYAAALDLAAPELAGVLARLRRRPGALAAVDQAAAMIRDELTADGQPLTRERIGQHWYHVIAETGPAPGITRRDYALTVAGLLQLAEGATPYTSGGPTATPDGELRTGQLADRLSVSRSTVIRLADAGILPCRRTPSGHRRFPPGAIHDLHAARHDQYDPRGDQ